MIRFVRTASIAPGRLREALAFAKEIGDHLQSVYGLKLEVLMPVGGNPQRIAWKADYPTLGDLETVMGKLLTDSKYLEISARGSANFIAGSMNDALWRTV